MKALLALLAALGLFAATGWSQEAAAPAAESAAVESAPVTLPVATPTTLASQPLLATPVPLSTPQGTPLTPRSGTPLEKASPYRSADKGVGQLAVYLFLLLVLFGLGLYVMRNGLPTLGVGAKSERKLHIEEMRSLGGRQFLVVAEYEGQKMLLGVVPGRIEHLCVLKSAPVPTFPEIGPDNIEEAKG